ncbi:MAG: AI-2E family transporter [Microcoleaceae cyanobacterium]
MREQKVIISLSTFLTILASSFILFVGWQVKGLLVLLMVAVVIAATISPLVNWAEKRKVPRWIAVIFVYLSLIGTVTLVIALIGPNVISQIEKLISQLPLYSENIDTSIEGFVQMLIKKQPAWLDQYFDSQSISRWVISSSRLLLLKSYSFTRGFIGGLFSLILALFLSGYMVSDSRTLIKGLTQLFPPPWDDKLLSQVGIVADRMGGYIRGRVLVSTILAVITTICLDLLGVHDFSLALGAIAGVTNLIPFIGPILGAIPAVIIALAMGGWLILWVILLYLILQNLESYVLDPLLVGNSVGVHPLYQLLSVLVGVQLLGIIGALIVPPWFAGASALVENLYVKPKLIAEGKSIK